MADAFLRARHDQQVRVREGTNITLSWVDLGDGTTLDVTVNASGGGGGDAVSVNGAAVMDADLDDATPIAPAGSLNVAWAASGAGPANISASVGASALLDVLGATRGSVLYRGASGWAILTPGTAGHALTSNGAGADPSYQAAAGSGLADSHVMARVWVMG